MKPIYAPPVFIVASCTNQKLKPVALVYTVKKNDQKQHRYIFSGWYNVSPENLLYSFLLGSDEISLTERRLEHGKHRSSMEKGLSVQAKEASSE